MDLRSAHKVKPSPRLRLSLTRAMSTDIDQGERAAMYRRPLWRKNRQRGLKGSHRTICPLRKKKSVEEDWTATSEEEKQETKRSKDVLYGQSVRSIFYDTFDFSRLFSPNVSFLSRRSIQIQPSSLHEAAGHGHEDGG